MVFRFFRVLPGVHWSRRPNPRGIAGWGGGGRQRRWWFLTFRSDTRKRAAGWDPTNFLRHTSSRVAPRHEACPRKSAPPEALANQGRVTAVSVPLREFAEDSVRSLEGLDVPSPPMPQGHLPLHLLRQGVLGPEPHAPMRHFLPAQRGIGL